MKRLIYGVQDVLISEIGIVLFLKTVNPSGFDIKLEAFLSEGNNDKLFIVPAANIQPGHEILFKEKNARVLSVGQLRNSIVRGLFERKTILKVGPNELKLLVGKIFIGPWFKKAVILCAVILISSVVCLIAFHPPKQPVEKPSTECIDEKQRKIIEDALVERAEKQKERISELFQTLIALIENCRLLNRSRLNHRP